MTRARGYTAAMTKRIALLTLLSCLLAACGNKGPLVLPDAPAPADTSVDTPAETPAEAPAAAPPDTPAAPAAEPPAGDDAGTPATRP